MVIRPRIRAFLASLGLYVLAAAFIGYFGVNAYTGNHGIRAKQTLDQRIADLTHELDADARRARALGAPRRPACAPTASTPTCSTSGRGSCSTSPIPATSRRSIKRR